MRILVVFIILLWGCTRDPKVPSFPYKIKSAKYLDSYEVVDGHWRYVIVGSGKEEIINALDTMGFKIHVVPGDCFVAFADKDSVEHCEIQLCKDTTIIRYLIGEFVQ